MTRDEAADNAALAAISALHKPFHLILNHGPFPVDCGWECSECHQSLGGRVFGPERQCRTMEIVSGIQARRNQEAQA